MDDPAIPEKRDWPKTPGGTIDWEVVFEDPDSGLLSLLGQAKTASALRDITILVIQKLYTRKDDPPEVERFIAEITRMIPDDAPADNLAPLCEAVSSILRQVKTERIRKAAEYEKLKAEEEAAGKVDPGGDRRERAKQAAKAAAKGQADLGIQWKAKGPSKLLLALGGGGALVAIGAVVALMVPSGPEKKPEENQGDPTHILVDQMEAFAAGRGPRIHVFGGVLKWEQRAGIPAVAAEAVPGDICAGAAWMLVNRGRVIINDMMPRKVSPNVLAQLCAKGPNEGATLTWLPKQAKQK